jgi:hypothetical protein
MTFSTRPLLTSAPRMLAVAFVATLAALALTAAGCEDKHIGRPCDLAVKDGGIPSSGNTATINSQAVECPSRICLLPAADKNADKVGALCTADCSSDEDCEDGETSSAAGRCSTGFICMVPTTVGDFCCRKMCVCKDLIDTSNNTYQQTPEVCKAGQSTCKNVH